MSTFPKPGEVFAKRYELVEVIGTGGLSTVFKARQSESNRSIALKILPKEVANDSDFVKRFLREAKALSRLSHTGIVSIYHIGVSEDGLPYLAMELIRGKSLKQHIKEEGPFPVTRALRITRQAAEALAYIHTNGIVHRDLKPDNIAIVDKPEVDTVKIIDFGLARFLQDQKSTKTGTVVGSVNYMSPEQCEGKQADNRSDIYSLSLCFYEMLIGKKAFSAESPVGLIYQHINSPIPRITADQISPFTPEVNDFFAKGLAKSPESRFASMQDFIASLDRLSDKFEHASNRKLKVTSSDLKFLGLGAIVCLLLIAGLAAWIPHNSAPGVDISSKKSSTKLTLERALEIISTYRRRGLPLLHRDVLTNDIQLIDDYNVPVDNNEKADLEKYMDHAKIDALAKACLLVEFARISTNPDQRVRYTSEAFNLAQEEYGKHRTERTLKVLLSCGTAYAEALTSCKRFQESDKTCNALLKLLRNSNLSSNNEEDYNLIYLVHGFSADNLRLVQTYAYLGMGKQKEAEQALDQILKSDGWTKYEAPTREIIVLITQVESKDRILRLINSMSKEGNYRGLLEMASLLEVQSRQYDLADKAASSLEDIARSGGLRYEFGPFAELQLLRADRFEKQGKKAEAQNILRKTISLIPDGEGYEYFPGPSRCQLIGALLRHGLKTEAHGLLIDSKSSIHRYRFPEGITCMIRELSPFAKDDPEIASVVAQLKVQSGHSEPWDYYSNDRRKFRMVHER